MAWVWHGLHWPSMGMRFDLFSVIIALSLCSLCTPLSLSFGWLSLSPFSSSFCTVGSGPSLPHFINNETDANFNHLTSRD